MDPKIERKLKDRNRKYFIELENYFRNLIVDNYEARQNIAWKRNYSSVEVYKKSIENNKNRWESVLNPPKLEVINEIKFEPYNLLPDVNSWWIQIPLKGGLDAEGIFSLPGKKENDNLPNLVIAQHGISSTPEHTFGIGDDTGAYHAYSKALLDAGFAVLAPFNLAISENRNRIQRMATLIGTSLPGLEFARLQHLLDKIINSRKVKSNSIGMWGISLGGLATQFWMPLEPRIKVGICSAWFNKRLYKMVIPDPRYSCFLPLKEEHIFISGWLTEFTDSDLISLICPRPYMIQTGKADDIGWWPMIQDEYKKTKEHYEKLDISERICMDLHKGGHEVRITTGIDWLKKWLNK